MVIVQVKNDTFSLSGFKGTYVGKGKRVIWTRGILVILSGFVIS